MCDLGGVQFRAGIQGFDLDTKRDNEKKTKSRLCEKVVHYARTQTQKQKASQNRSI